MADFRSDDERDDERDETGPDARPQTLLMGLATGGLLGMLTALDTSDDETEDDGVEDPEALRRAEEAVSHDPVERPHGPHIDEPWTTVATQYRSDDYVGLMDVAAALDAEGIDYGWNPYDPRQRSDLAVSTFGEAVRRPYSIQVPESELGRARDALYGVPPDGVTYAWSPGPAPQRSLEAASSGDADPIFASAASTPRPVTGYGPDLSDNDRLEQLAGTGAPAGAIALAVVGGLVAIGAAAFLLSR